jgi:hypothetical protein
LAVLTLAALLTAASSVAGTITVVNLPATGTDAATGISATNTYLFCIDFGNNTNPPSNINGVPFIHRDLGNQIVNTTNGFDGECCGRFSRKYLTASGSVPWPASLAMMPCDQRRRLRN